MSPRVKGALLLLVAFALGAAAGAAGFGVYKARTGWWRPPDPARLQERVLERLTKELALRPEQRQQVEAVLKKSSQDFATLREEIGPKFREIRSHARDQIRAVLDPAQQTKFDAVVQKWERRAERWRDREGAQGSEEKKAP